MSFFLIFLQLVLLANLLLCFFYVYDLRENGTARALQVKNFGKVTRKETFGIVGGLAAVGFFICVGVVISLFEERWCHRS